MGLTIWKFSVAPGEFTLEMPRGAAVLSVQMQAGEPVMWALVDSSRPTEARRFAVYGTGHEISRGTGDFYGTFQMGPLVFHLFEMRAPHPKEGEKKP